MSERLKAQLEDGLRYELDNEYLRGLYGLPRITAAARRELADDLKRVGLVVVSDPNVEPLVVQRRGRARKPRWLKAILAAAVPFLGTVGSVFAYFGNDLVCHEVVARSGLDFALCPAEDRPVNKSEAQEAVDMFFARAGGAQPDNAWRILRGKHDRDTFLASWEPVLGAETTKVREADGFNLFKVGVRTYREENRDPAKTWEVQVLHTDDGGFAIGAADPVEPINGPPRQVHSVEYARRMNLRRRPRMSSLLTVRAGTKQINVGGTLKALCQIDIPAVNRPRDREWWTLTDLGWARNIGLGAGTNKPLPGVGMCFPYAREL